MTSFYYNQNVAEKFGNCKISKYLPKIIFTNLLILQLKYHILIYSMNLPPEIRSKMSILRKYGHSWSGCLRFQDKKPCKLMAVAWLQKPSIVQIIFLHQVYYCYRSRFYFSACMQFLSPILNWQFSEWYDWDAWATYSYYRL